MKKIAIIDLGSNSIRMSMYQIDKCGISKEIGNYRSMIKLSEGMSRDGLISPESQIRAINAILEYKRIILSNNIHSIKAVATAAVRKAKNGVEFIKTVKDATEISIEVIDGQREAYYDFLAVTNSHPCQNGIICDIGGGSTELIGIRDGAFFIAESIPIGSRGITENFFADGSSEKFADAKLFIQKQMAELSWLKYLTDAPIFGVGGCLRAIAKYDSNDATNQKIKNHPISAERIKELFSHIISANIEERKAMTGIGEERADIIIGGIAIAEALFELTHPTELIVSDVGIRDGILLEFIK